MCYARSVKVEQLASFSNTEPSSTGPPGLFYHTSWPIDELEIQSARVTMLFDV